MRNKKLLIRQIIGVFTGREGADNYNLGVSFSYSITLVLAGTLTPMLDIRNMSIWPQRSGRQESHMALVRFEKAQEKPVTALCVRSRNKSCPSYLQSSSNCAIHTNRQTCQPWTFRILSAMRRPRNRRRRCVCSLYSSSGSHGSMRTWFLDASEWAARGGRRDTWKPNSVQKGWLTQLWFDGQVVMNELRNQANIQS